MKKTALSYFDFLSTKFKLDVTVGELSDIYHACEMYKTECLQNKHKVMYEAMVNITKKLKEVRDILDNMYEANKI